MLAQRVPEFASESGFAQKKHAFKFTLFPDYPHAASQLSSPGLSRPGIHTRWFGALNAGTVA